VKCGLAKPGEASTVTEIVLASPGTKLITPGGKPAASRNSTNKTSLSEAVAAAFRFRRRDPLAARDHRNVLDSG
jgi:hypothetical protein